MTTIAIPDAPLSTLEFYNASRPGRYRLTQKIFTYDINDLVHKDDLHRTARVGFTTIEDSIAGESFDRMHHFDPRVAAFCVSRLVQGTSWERGLLDDRFQYNLFPTTRRDGLTFYARRPDAGSDWHVGVDVPPEGGRIWREGARLFLWLPRDD